MASAPRATGLGTRRRSRRPATRNAAPLPPPTHRVVTPEWSKSPKDVRQPAMKPSAGESGNEEVPEGPPAVVDEPRFQGRTLLRCGLVHHGLLQALRRSASGLLPATGSVRAGVLQEPFATAKPLVHWPRFGPSRQGGFPGGPGARVADPAATPQAVRRGWRRPNRPGACVDRRTGRAGAETGRSRRRLRALPSWRSSPGVPPSRMA